MPLFMLWSVYVWLTCTYALVLPQSFWVLYLAKNNYTSQANWMPLVSFLFITDYNQLKFSLTAPVGDSHQSRALALGLTCGGSMSSLHKNLHFSPVLRDVVSPCMRGSPWSLFPLHRDFPCQEGIDESDLLCALRPEPWKDWRREYSVLSKASFLLLEGSYVCVW